MKRIFLFILFALVITACGSKNDSADKASTDAKSKKEASKKPECDKVELAKRRGPPPKECKEEVIINIEAEEIVLGSAISVYKSTTLLEANEESEVTTKASGIVLKINNEVGDTVKEGDILAILESDQQKLRLQSARANYQKSQHNHERAKLLLSKGLANKESVDNLKFETQSLLTNLEQAKLELEYTRVRAPISGVITERHIKKGNLLPMNFAVYKIVNFETLQAVINVPEDKWNLFKPELEVKLIFNNISEEVKGSILRIEPGVNSSTGTFKVVIEIDKTIENQKVGLRPGLFGKTLIILDKRENVPLISKNALIREDKNSYTYVVTGDNTVEKINLKLGFEMDESVEITEGLTGGEKVITTGKNNVSPDSKVNIVTYND